MSMDANDPQTWTTVHLKEYIERILTEQNRALDQAGEEREKSASILREGLISSIAEGDRALRDHVAAQVDQLRSQLAASVALTEANFKASSERTTGVRNELLLIAEAAKEAVIKAEVATDKRFEGINDFRGELSDRWDKTLPREVAESQFSDIQKRIDINASGIGGALAREEFRSTISEWADWRQNIDRRMAEQQGSAQGVKQFVGIALTAASVLIGFVVAFANGAI